MIRQGRKAGRQAGRCGLLAWLMLATLASTADLHAQESGQAEAELLVAEARDALLTKEYGRAARLLDRALVLAPQRVELYVLRASVHSARKEYDQGVALMRRAVKLAPDSLDVLSVLGSQLTLSGRHGEGVPILEKVVAQASSRYEAQVLLGHHYARQRMWQQAVRAFEAYLKARPAELTPEDPIHQVALAHAYLRNNQPGVARQLYGKILAREPRNTQARLGLAWAVAAVDCRQAAPMLRELGKLAERHPEIMNVQARCALMLGQLEEAVSMAHSYRDQRPADPAGWALLGDGLAARGDIAEALKAHRAAVQRAPTNRLYAFKLARLENRIGSHRAAAQRLQAAGPPLGMEDQWTEELGEALFADGQYAELRRMLSQYVTTQPRSATARTLLGITSLKLGDPRSAIGHLEQAIGLAPRSPRPRQPLVEAYNALATSALAAGDLKGAEENLLKASRVPGADYRITLRNLGAVRLAAGNAAGALAPLERAASASRDPLASHLLGRAQRASGDAKKALRTLRDALELPTSNEHAAALAIDYAGVALAEGQAQEALAALEKAMTLHSSDELTAAYFTALRAVATEALGNGQFATALRALEEAEKRLGETGDEPLRIALTCDLALAATGLGKRELAQAKLGWLAQRDARCPFAAPADRLAVPILMAWNEGSQAKAADRVLARLNALRRRATGPAEPLLRGAARDIALRAAIDAYQNGEAAEARRYFEIAEQYDNRSPEVQHNVAVLLLAQGNVEAAITRLGRLTRTVPEALANLGIAYDLKNQPDEALDFYRKAADAGLRSSKLTEWIATKERIWGGK
jgi:Flp pilus assembly protein TadD